MTLNITLINQHGIWQCSDNRLVDLVTGATLVDNSMKHVALRCPDGVALIAYAGIGLMKPDIEISDWIREILRGETRTVDESLVFIREAATRDLGPALAGRYHHMFTVGAFLNGKPWLAQIRNFSVPSPLSPGPPLPEFMTVAERVPSSGVVSTFGASVSSRDGKRLDRIANRRPRKPKQFMDLLASVSQATAKKLSKTVSPHCLVTYAPPTGEPLKALFYAAGGPPSAKASPFLLFGIDITDLENHAAALLAAVRNGTDPPPAPNGSYSTTPRNRLRRR